MSKLGMRTVIFLVVFCVVGAIGSAAETFRTLVFFNGTDAANPGYGSLVQGFNGNFYGTTVDGGGATGFNMDCRVSGCGTVFEITPGGQVTKLHSFCSQTDSQLNCTDGAIPYGGLVQSTNGNFYGTTSEGGASNFGTVFEITPGGQLTTLHSFCSTEGCTDSTTPYAGLIQATDGNFYGTTSGTVFKITPGGILTTLHNFNGVGDGSPVGELTQGTDGNFYGTTPTGGTSSFCSGGCGTVFKITPGGTYTRLHSFDGADGIDPYAGPLVQAHNGNFYGTTVGFGIHSEGTVFEITPAGQLTTLYRFCSKPRCTDGFEPAAGLVQAIDGTFYGTTTFGGASSACTGDFCGTVFEITPAGQLTTLHSFDYTDGSVPLAGLVQATNGNFYGTTSSGGSVNGGTAFSLGVGLGPFVEALPTSGRVGATVIILGNTLTGATSVTFNGTAATFRVISSSEIMTTIPRGATTGPVKVRTPSRTLTSNVNFRVS